MKAKVDKPDINELVNVPARLNNLKTKVDALDVGKVKAVPVDLRKLSNVMDDEVVKSTIFNKLKTKKNNFDNKTPDATIFIDINQYNTDKQSLKKTIEMLVKKYQIFVDW